MYGDQSGEFALWILGLKGLIKTIKKFPNLIGYQLP